MRHILCLRWAALLFDVLLAIPAFGGISGEVVAVFDGDTIEVLHNGKAQRVRLYGLIALRRASRSVIMRNKLSRQ